MPTRDRQINMKKFLSLWAPDAQESNFDYSRIPKEVDRAADLLKKYLTLWAPTPEKMANRVRRAADIYRDMAARAEIIRHPHAKGWSLVAQALEIVAARLESEFPQAC